MPTPIPPVAASAEAAAGALLNDWLAAEAALRERHARGVGPGVAAREQVARMDGLSMLRAMQEGRGPTAPIGHTLGFLLVEVGEGRAVFQGTPAPAYFNPMGGIHGGWYATLLDSALGCAVHTLMPAGRAYTTSQINIHLVRGIGPQVQRVRAEGQVIHCGRQMATAEARLVGPDGTLYAHGTTTCLVFDLPPARP
ncbi:MAG: PaaI family thioesterase [Rubrivivax sp.]|nr:PaaI family thioesterase [Rubrivivax sp.]